MKRMQQVTFSLFIVVMYTHTLLATGTFSSSEGRHETDTQALHDYIQAKSAVTVLDKGTNLCLSGDVRTKWEHLQSKSNGKNVRGHGTGNAMKVPFATNICTVEFNTLWNYKADCSWATIHLKLKNNGGTYAYTQNAATAGVANRKKSLFGSCGLQDIRLRKAFIGYNIYEHDTARAYTELGRRRIYDIFDSKVQFNSTFDAFLLSYIRQWEHVMNVQAKIAPFVIDNTVNHCGVVGEMSACNIAESGFDAKYSYIDWCKNGLNRYRHSHVEGAQFAISQYTVAYTLPIKMLPRTTQVYGAYLTNHKAHLHHWPHGTHARHAWYVGCSVGELKKAHDFAIDINYRWIQAQAIPERDVRDLYRDSPTSVSMYVNPAAGFANCKGVWFDGLYNVTSNVALEIKAARIRQCQKKIGGTHRAWDFQVQALYVF